MLSFSLILLSLFFSVSHEWCQKFKQKQSNQIISVSFSKDNFYLAVAIKDTNVKIYSTMTYTLLKTYTFGTSKPQQVRFSQDGKYLGIAYDSNDVKILNALEPFGDNTTVTVSHNSFTVDLDFDKNGNFLLTCGNDNKLKLWTIVHGGTWTYLRQKLPVAEVATSCKFSFLNNYISYSSTNGLYAYGFGLGAPIGFKTGRQFSESAISIDQTRLYASTIAQKKLFQYSGSFTQSTLLTTTKILSTVDVSASGKYVMTGGQQKILYILNQTSFNHSTVYQMLFADWIWDAQFSKDSKMFALGLKNFQFYIYTEECIQFCQVGFFYHSTTKKCQKCSMFLTKCTICQNVTFCKQCQIGYYLNITTKLCSSCNIMEGCAFCTAFNVCSSCYPGYSIVSGKCQKCSKNIKGCNLCDSTTVCTSCLNDFYLNSTDFKCKICSNSTVTSMSNCLKCSSDSFCVECVPGYYATSLGVCTKCDPLCLSCSGTSTNCSQCTLGYYTNPPTSYSCQACAYGCLTCNASNYCFDCWDSMYQKADGTCSFCIFPCLSCQNTTYCFNCVDHYFLNATDSLCYRCQNNCNTCNSSSYCVSCFQGFYLRTTDNTCQTCQKITPFCTQCNSTACIMCVRGFYYSTPALACLKCISTMYQCVSCKSSTSCQQCSSGYYLTASSANLSCAACAKQCQTCTASNVCSKCFSGYYLQTTNSTCMSCQLDHCTQCITKAVCSSCQLGYYLQASTKKCLICTLEGCYQCVQITAAQKCQLCIPGYYFDSTTKTCKRCNFTCITCQTSATLCKSCAIGYYLNSGLNQCVICPINCTQCYDSLVCTSCNYGFYLDSATKKCLTCVSKFTKACISCNAISCLLCQNSYYLTNTTLNTPPQICKTCSDIDLFCLECNKTQCLKCSYGSFLDTSVSPNKCKTCQVSLQGCQNCSSGSVCLICQNGYYLNTVSKKCIPCTQGCNMCDSSSICKACNSLYFYQTSNNTCTLCQKYINGCQRCTPLNKLYCQECQNGFYLSIINLTNSKCLYCSQAISGCAYCNASNTCTMCFSQYYLDSTLIVGSTICSKCAVKIPGCQICNQSTVCVDCQNGFYLQIADNLCYKCSIKISGCVFCNTNGNLCNRCDTGYFLQSSDSKCKLCSSSQTGCQLCEQKAPGQINCIKSKGGFYLKLISVGLYQAVVCISQNCEICLQQNSSKCSTCDSGYYLETSLSTCLSCDSSMSGCLTCSNNSVCSTCQTGLYLNSATNKCNACLSKYSNCLICTQTECLKCKGLYAVNSTTKNCDTCMQKFNGCKYCNQTVCFYCANNYFKSGSICQPCQKITGCLACNSLGVCLNCKQNYLLVTSNSTCTGCDTFVPNCFACTSQTVCVLCQSGYLLGTTGVCEQVTTGGASASSSTQSSLKLTTEYVSQTTLKQFLYSSEYEFTKIELESHISEIQLFMVYTKNGTVNKQPLTIISYQWSNLNSKVLIIYTNNPLNVKTQSMDIYRRRLQTGQSPASTILLKDTAVQLSLSESLSQQMLPDMKAVGDTQVQYDLSKPEFYASYLKQNNLQIWYLVAYGYVIVFFLVINYLIRSFVTKRAVQTDHGEMIFHYLALAAPCLILYPTTVEILSFCYGFMLLNFPWYNQTLGQMLGNSFDSSPSVMKIFFVNLNIGSTYAISLGAIIFILILGYSIIAICSNNQAKKTINHSVFFNYLYNIFSYGALFSSMLAVQGCFMNPINQLFKFDKVINSGLYLTGLFICFLFLVDLIHSLFTNAQRYFYKLRNFLKVLLLSLCHLNPTYFFSVVVILDLIFVAGDYFICKKQQKDGYIKIWITKNIILDVSLILLNFFPNKFLSIVIVMVLVFISVILQIYEHVKVGQQRSYVKNDTQEYTKTASKTLQTTYYNQKTSRNNTRGSNAWNLDFDYNPKIHVSENSNQSLTRKLAPPTSSKKVTSRNNNQNQNDQSIDKMHQTIQHEPRRRRQRKRSTGRANQSHHQYKTSRQSNKDQVLHVKKRQRYDQNQELQRISDF